MAEQSSSRIPWSPHPEAQGAFLSPCVVSIRLCNLVVLVLLVVLTAVVVSAVLLTSSVGVVTDLKDSAAQTFDKLQHSSNDLSTSLVVDTNALLETTTTTSVSASMKAFNESQAQVLQLASKLMTSQLRLLERLSRLSKPGGIQAGGYSSCAQFCLGPSEVSGSREERIPVNGVGDSGKGDTFVPCDLST